MTAITPQDRPLVPPAVAGRFIARLALMSLLWLGLNGTDWNSWIVGGPVVLAAAGLSVKLLPILSWRWSPRGAIAFAGFFVRESLRGGWDVAWRAFSSKPSLSPGILCFPSRLPEGAARLWFCGTISLLPGTAVVAIAEKEIRVHVLDITPHAEEELRELERRVAALFGLKLPGQQEGAP